MAQVATTSFNEDGVYKMVYHKTMVASYDPKTKLVTLNTGGYATRTTVKRMNQFANDHGLGFRVYRKDFAVYVDYPASNLTLSIADNVSFHVL